MPLISCKVELKLRCQSIVLSVAGTANANGNNDVILFLLSKTQNYMFLY